MVQCENIPDVPNGKRNPAEDSVACGAKVTYTCSEGPILERDSVLECGADGLLKGQLPVCKTSGNFHLCDVYYVEF